MSEEEVDGILARTEDALAQLDLAQGSLVKLPRLELELLEQLEAARDLMISVLHSKERSLLVRIFGGDCVRVSRVRAVLDSVRFSSMQDRLLRLRSCLGACEMVEEVLGDLGLGFALCQAQARQRKLLTERRCQERRMLELRAGREVPELIDGGELQGPPEVLEALKAPARLEALGTPATLEMPVVPEAPVAPVTPEARGALGALTVLAASETPPVPEASEALDASAGPEALGAPEVLEGPGALDLSAALGAPDAPAPPEAPMAPDVVAELEALDPTEGPEALGAPAGPEALEAPEAPEALAVPEVPGTAEAPEAPLPPEAPQERAEEPEVTEAPSAPEPLDLPEVPEALEAPAAPEPPAVLELPEAAVPALEKPELRAANGRLEARKGWLVEEQRASEKCAVESVLLPEPSEEQSPTDEQLEEEAAAIKAGAADAIDRACAKPTALVVERTPSFEQAAAALRDIVQPPTPPPPPAPERAAGGGRRRTAPAAQRRRAGMLGAEPEAEPLVLEPGECSDSPETEPSVSQSEEADAEADFGSCVLELPPWLEQLLQRLFAFYAGTDGTSAGAGIGLTRFRSFLRDAGLLRAADASAAMQSLSQASGEPNSAPPSARRRSSISRGGLQLPLTVFPEPPLTLVQADIMHVTARERQPVIRSYMTLDAFCWSVADVAIYCQQRGLLECGGTADEIVVAFCERLMVPLGEFLGLGEEGLRLALVLREEAAPLFQQAKAGLFATFAQRARGVGAPEPYRRGHWTLQALRRFATDLDLVAEMSHSALQRVFDTCVQHEAKEERGMDGMLSFQGFKLAFVMIAQRVHNAPECSSMERLALLMLRLGATQGASDIGAAARSVLGAPGKKGAGARGRQRLPRRTL